MGYGFKLSSFPWVYKGRYTEDGTWFDEFEEKSPGSFESELSLSPEEQERLAKSRNSFSDIGLVNYTSQYGLGCFEGLKAYPQRDGSTKLFRPDQNGKRMARSMEGLLMPAFPEDKFVEVCLDVIRKNRECGYTLDYNPAWEKTNFVTADSIYIRPFSYSEDGIGVNPSKFPWVVVIATPVGAYFQPGSSHATTTRVVRANRGGIGHLKCAANYVTSILEKTRAINNGYIEVIFLDALEAKYVEEGSSCNIFFLLNSGVLVTPELCDTILPGINRASVITLAKDRGVSVEERAITIEEAMGESREVFVTGTAAGVTYLESLTHNGKKQVFNGGTMGELTTELLHTLKGIQYGLEEDRHGWMYTV